MSSSRRPRTGWDSSGLYAPCLDPPLFERCTKGVTKSLSRIDHIEGIKCYESESTPQHLENSQGNPISIFSSRCRRCWICRQTRIVTVGNLTVSVTKKGKQRVDVTKSRRRNQIMTNRINNQKWASRSRKDFFIKAFEAFLHRCYILHWRLFHTLSKFWFKEGCRIAKHLRRKMCQVSRFLKAYHVPGDLQRRALFSVETIRKRNLRFQEILVTSLHFQGSQLPLAVLWKPGQVGRIWPRALVTWAGGECIKLERRVSSNIVWVTECSGIVGKISGHRNIWQEVKTTGAKTA